jgi:hypothetical protein
MRKLKRVLLTPVMITLGFAMGLSPKAWAEVPAPPKGTAKLVPETPEAATAITGLTMESDLDVRPGEELEPEKKAEEDAAAAAEAEKEKKEEEAKALEEKKEEKKEADGAKTEEAPKESKKGKKGKKDKSEPKAEEKSEAKPSSFYSERLERSWAQVEKVTVAANPDPVVYVQGSFTNPDRKLFIGFDPVRITRDKKFKIEIPISGAETTIEFVSRLRKGTGEEEKAKFVIRFPDWKKFSGDPKIRKQTSERLWAGASLGSLSYKEGAGTSSPVDASELALSVWGSYERPISDKFPKWNARGFLSFTLLPVGGKPAGYRYLNIALGGVYAAWKNDLWQINIVTGFRYLGMLVSGKAFGFAGATGIQAFPQVIRKLANGNLAIGYVSLSPVSTYFGFIPSSTNSELCIGGTYIMMGEGKKPLGITFEFSSLNLEIDSIPLSASNILVGASYSFF